MSEFIFWMAEEILPDTEDGDLLELIDNPNQIVQELLVESQKVNDETNNNS